MTQKQKVIFQIFLHSQVYNFTRRKAQTLILSYQTCNHGQHHMPKSCGFHLARKPKPIFNKKNTHIETKLKNRITLQSSPQIAVAIDLTRYSSRFLLNIAWIHAVIFKTVLVYSKDFHVFMWGRIINDVGYFRSFVVTV